MNEVTTDQSLSLDELTYRNYKWNRLQNPKISAQRWKRVFPSIMVDYMEARVIAETKNLKIAVR